MRRDTHFRQFRAPQSLEPTYQPVGDVISLAGQECALHLKTAAAAVEVTALAPDLFRVGVFSRERPADYTSEALARTDWQPTPATIERDEKRALLQTSQATAVVRLNPLRLAFEGADGRRFAEDDPQLGMGFFPLGAKGEQLVDPLGMPSRVYKSHPASEHYFGCGERTGGLDKTDSHQVFWNFDPPSEHTASLNNMYTSIPFLLALDHGAAWGLFLDNAGRVEFDLAREHPERSWFGAETGDLIYYVFAGPTPRAVLERYTELTGRTPLPPLWALGNHQSRWGYKSADEIRAIAREFRSRDIPCDALYLDIDYMDGYRVFTWDPERFPDPGELTSDLKDQGFHVVTIVDPGIKVDPNYPAYQEAHDAELFCKTFLGDEYRNVVWPGTCAFPDFTNPEARRWWGEWLSALLEHGVAGIWCDMNEPAVFVPTPQTFPPDVVHEGGGRPTLHAQVHNLYGSLMARATREGLERLRPEQRPFVISRAGYAGLQRHALHWTGDNSSWWEHLWMSMPQLQNLGLSGLAWAGVDVGGFTGNATGELLTRWIEFGAFQPFCRNHSSWVGRPQEPWVFGEAYERPIRDMLKLRQRLIPYLYSLFDECHRTGAPILRPLLFEYPEDETIYTAADEFMVGPALLVAPIATPGTEHRHVYLPAGTWYQFWTNERIDGPAHVLAHAPLGQPAVYVRSNTPIPLWPAMSHVDERPADPLTVLLFPSEGGGSFTLYEDAGDGFLHKEGVYARTTISCNVSNGRIVIRLSEPEGSLKPARETLELQLRGVPKQPTDVRIDGRPAHTWQHDGQTVTIRLRAASTSFLVEVRLDH